MTEIKNVPYFIQIRGCINCPASKDMRQKHGHDYGFDHEIMAMCLIQNCVSSGYDLSNPFIDPEELVRYVKKNPSQETIKNAARALKDYQEKFGVSFRQVGVNRRPYPGTKEAI